MYHTFRSSEVRCNDTCLWIVRVMCREELGVGAHACSRVKQPRQVIAVNYLGIIGQILQRRQVEGVSQIDHGVLVFIKVVEGLLFSSSVALLELE